MRTLILATVSAVALGFAGIAPGFAAQNTETMPGPAVTQPAAPASPNQNPTMPQNRTTAGQSATEPSSQANAAGMSSTPESGTTAMQATPSEIRQAQEKLQDEGLYHGKVDGQMGPETQQALRQYQEKNNLQATAKLDQETMNSLLGPGAGQGSSMPNATTPTSGAGASGSNSTGYTTHEAK